MSAVDFICDALAVIAVITLPIALIVAAIRKIGKKKTVDPEPITNPQISMEREYQTKLTTIRREEAVGCEVLDNVEIGRRDALIGLTADGDAIRLISWIPLPPNMVALKRATYSSNQIVSATLGLKPNQRVEVARLS